MMGGIGILFWLLPRRLRASWVLLGITSFGILAAVTLMAVAPILSRALAEGGLRHTLASTPATVLNAWVIIQNRPLGPADYQKLRTSTEEIAIAHLGYMLRDTQRFGRTQPDLPLSLTPEETAPPLDALIGRPFFLTNFQTHSRIVEGRWPEPTPISLSPHPSASSGLPLSGAKGQALNPLPPGERGSTPSPLQGEGLDGDERLELEMAIGKKAASETGLKVGSQVYLIPFRNDPSERITLSVVGLVEPIDPDAEYWMHGSSAYFRLQEYGERVLLPIYVPEEAFFGGLGASYPSLVGDYGWFLFFDTSVLTAATVKPTRDAIIGLETDLNKRFPRSIVLSGLKNTLSDYQKDLTHARVPIFLFISLVLVVILYFLALVMGLLARTRSDEASLLRSRGASMLQVGGLLALGEGAVALLAMALGPFLALLILRHLLLGTIDPLGEGSASPSVGSGPAVSVGLSADMFLMGAIGGLLSLGVLLASGMSLARLGMVEFLRVRARPPTVPFLHRYYVDLLVLAAGGILWWQAKGRGGFMETALSSQDPSAGSGQALGIDPSLLFGPVLVLLAAAFLLLRFLPLLLGLLAWAGRFIAPAWATFTLLRLSRDPLPHGSLTIILMLAAALGVFGATFQSTLSRSQQDQALYDVGGDLVIKGHPFPSSTREELATMPGVQRVSPILRDSVNLLEGSSSASVSLLVVDPITLPDAAWFRDDFAGKSLPQLLRPLRQGAEGLRQAQGVPIPTDSQSIGVWVNTQKLNWGLPQHRLSLWVHVSDATGQYRSLPLGDLQPPGSGSVPQPTPEPAPSTSSGQALSLSKGQGWTYLEASLPKDQPALEPPLTLVSIFIGGGSLFRMSPGSIGLDDVTVKGPFTPPDGVVIEGFEEPRQWVPLTHGEPVADTVERTPQAARSGRTGLVFTWQQGSQSDPPRGILLPPGPFPLPAIGGPTFQPEHQLRIRSGKQFVPLIVQDVTNYFPTIDPSSRPFLLVSLEDYQKYVQRIPGGFLKPPEEAWVALKDTADRRQTALSLEEHLTGFVSIQDRAAVADRAERNPLAGGSWNGLTLLGIFSLSVAVVLALAIHTAVAVHTGRLDLSLTRALGFSRGQLFLSLSLERIIVAVVGIAAGSAIGIWLGRWVLGFLDITASGQEIIPPVVFTVQEWLIALVFVNLIAASLLALLFATLSARRLRVPEVLRTGE